MNIQEIKTLAALKKQGYVSKKIKAELRDNLMEKLQNKAPLFEGIIGYQDTVIPQLIHAILSQHNINLLGLRGQAKTRIARSLTELLDEYIPIVEGSEINDDPMDPISFYAKELVEKMGDKTPISWVHRSERFSEKLATPDVTVADLIGDVDPIKAANLKLSYADERVIHFGMIPRANRCIFVINELPDLQARIQVSLFNILQEGDVQIRGFKIRLPLDVNFVFTANPEDYTNRGSIVTPLKDRIGSQIITHYPNSIELAKQITNQEVKTNAKSEAIYVPELAKTLIEQIGFEARDNELVDPKSGISARMSITMYENLISGATYRMLVTQQEKTAVRMSDFLAVIPAITGKVELVYEGEQEGAENVALLLLGNAIKSLFNDNFREIKKLSKPGTSDEFDAVVSWFMENSSFSLSGDLSNMAYAEILNAVQPLEDIVDMYQAHANAQDKLFLKEFLLWGLVEYNKLDKQEAKGGFQFEDRVLGSFYNN
ncbi:MAG: magnesium chelatase [Crocinitomicaceae bacterium]|tara:strand:+ start:984 stop:2444 length:1461 start_codon:yes stop_codon:yes gene_type:complete